MRRILNGTDQTDLREELDMTATAAPRTVTGREVGAAKLLVTLDRIEGQITPKWVRDIADAKSVQPAATPRTAA